MARHANIAKNVESLNQMSSPLISVIMATYNRAHLVSHAIDSILSQTLPDFEFIIIDDGSTDTTQNIIKEYACQDHRIVCFHQINQGLAAARNYGAHQAQGRYLCFQDDDDISSPQRLEMQLHFLQQNSNLAACICPLNYSDDSKRRVGSRKLKNCTLTAQDVAMRSAPLPQLVLNSTTMIIKKAFHKCGGYRSFLNSAEDYDFTLRFQEQFEAGVVPEFLYNCPGTHQRDAITTQNYMRIMNTHLAAHISAWCRRNNSQDPIEKNKNLTEIMSLIPKMPTAARTHLIVYVKRCIHNIRKNHGCKERTKENIAQLNKLSQQLKPNMKPKQYLKILIMQLWLRYMAFLADPSTHK